MALLRTNTGIGTTNPTSALHVIGDVLVTGVVTATTFNGNINAGVGTITSLNSTNANLTNINSTGISTLGNVGISSNLVVSGIATFQSDIHLGDNDRIYFGDSNDLEIYNNGTSSIIRDLTGGTTYILGTNVQIGNTSATSDYAIFNGSVQLFNNGSKKFETTGTGVTIFDTLDTPYLNVSGVGTVTNLFGTNANLTRIDSTHINAGIVTATRLSIGAIGSAINITNDSITGPSSILIDPAAVGDDTGAVRIKGDLYVDGTEFVVNSTTIEFADFRVGIATTVGSNLLLDGAGIGIGSTNIQKTLTYDYSSDSLKSSENFDLNPGKVYKINETEVLSDNTLGSGVIYSSLQYLGTLNNLNVSGLSTLPTMVGTYATITELANTHFTSGIATITDLNVTNSTFTNLNTNNLNAVTGVVTDISGIRLNYTGIGTITNLEGTNITYTNSDFVNLNADNGYIVSGIITNISGTSLSYTGLSTVTNLEGTNVTYTNSDFINLNADNGYIVTGIITDLNNTRFVSGVGTITTLQGTNLTYTNSDFINLNADNGYIVSGIITDLSNSRIVSGVGTITTLNSSDANITNLDLQTLRVAGLSTFTNGPVLIGSGTQTGTLNQTLQVTGGAYISTYVGVGVTDPFSNVAIYDPNGAWISLVDPGQSSSAIENNNGTLYIRAEQGSGNSRIIFQTGTSNYQEKPSVSGSDRVEIDNLGNVLVNVDTPSGIADQKLQVTGGAYISGNTGIGLSNATSKLHVGGDVLVTGVVTATTFNGDINATNATITNLSGTNVTYTNSDFVNLNADNGYIVTGIITDINNSRLVSGVGTITTLNSTNATLTNINSTGISTIADIRTERVTATGIVTAFSFRPSSGYIQAADGTNSFYIYDTTGNVSFQGTIGVNQINNGGGFQVITFNNIDTRLTGNLNVTGVTTSSVFNGNIYSLGVSTFRNGPVLIGTGTSTGTAFQPLQVSGGAYISNSLGIGSQTPGSNLDVIGNAYVSGVVTATTFSGQINSGIATITNLNNTYLNSGVGTVTSLYSTNADLTNIYSTGISTQNIVRASTLEVSGVTTFQDNVYLGINDVLTIGGNSNYLKLFHDGGAAYIDNDTGILFYNAGQHFFQTANGTETLASFTGDGSAALYFDNVKRIETTGYGVTVYDTIQAPQVYITGVGTVANLNTTNLVSTNSDFTNLNADNAYISVGVVTDISGTNLNYTGVGTIATIDSTRATIVDIQNTNINNTGIATIGSLDVQNSFNVYSSGTFYSDLNIFGNVSIGGTTIVLSGDELRIKDKEIVLGITTNASNQDVSNDNTANHGGIAIASTEGYPLVNLDVVGINSLPSTYKQIMWVKRDTMGAGTTDAFLFNYAVGIGSTQVPNNVRLAVSQIQFTDNQINAETIEINRLQSGIATITGADISNLHSNNIYSQSGIITDLSGTRLNYTGFGTVTNLYSNIAYINDIASNTGFSTAFTVERLNVTGIATIANLNVVNSTVTNTNVDNLYAVTGVVTTLTSTHSNLTNINSTGISTLNILRANQIYSTGVVTAPTFVGDLLGVANYAHVSGFSTFSGYADASGVSTFSGYANNAGIATYTWTAGVSTYAGVAGYSTFSGYSDTSGFSTFSGYSNISGFSTFSGYANNAGISTYAWTAGVSTYSGVSGYSTFSGYSNTSGFSTFSGYSNNAGIATYALTAGVSTYAGVSGYSTFSGYSNTSGFSTFSGYANNAGIATYAQTSGVSTSVIGGLGSLNELQVTGISTFVNGPVLVGSTNLTGTFNQPLQVTGGGYISTNLGIGSTNPQYLLDVNGDINFNGNLYQNRQPFVSSRWSAGTGSDIYRMSQVGIGTTNPEYQLDVLGDVRIRGGIYDPLNNSAGLLNYVIVADGFGGWSWQPVTSAGAGTLDGIEVRDQGNVVGTSGSITTLDFRSDNTNNIIVTGIPGGNIATVSISNDPIFSTLGVLNTSGLGIATAKSLSVSGIVTATQFSTGAIGSAINITNNSITGPSSIVIDPAAVGDDTGAVRIKGDLYVDGTQFVVNSTTIELADFNVGIATTVGSNALLDGAGIGIGSANIRKTLTYDFANDALKSSENFNIPSGKTYKINGVDVLSSTTLGSGVVNSSLTSVGTLTNLQVSGVTTSLGGFVGNLTGNASSATYANVAGIATYANVAGIATYAHTAGVSTYAGVAGYSTFSGYSNTSGFSTFSGYSNTSGFSTFSGYANNAGIATYTWTAGVSTYSGVAGYSTFSGYSNTSGFSTFSGYANTSGISTYAWTAGVSTYSGVAGYSTFSKYSDASGFSTFSGYANNAGIATYTWTAGVSTYSGVSGFSTFSGYSNISGFSTFSGYANNAGIATYTWTAGVSTYSGLAGVSTSVIGGVASVTRLQVTGVSTFTTGPVFIGAATSTGTLDQDLQVTSGAYISGSTGIGTTNPRYKLDVIGDINFNGVLYQNGTRFTSGVGIGSTSVNPLSGVITPSARIGIGFTDINFVGTGLSITGYGSTVVIDFGNISGGGANVSISTVSPGISTNPGNLWWDSTSGDLKIYYNDGNSAQWIDANGGSQSLAIISDVSPTGYGITSAGTLWWDSNYGVLKIYYDDGDSTQWVDANSGAYINYWIGTSAGIHTLGNVGVGTTNPTEKLQVNGYLSIDGNVSYGTTTATTSTLSQTVIHSGIPTASYRSVEYTVQATQGTNFHTTKIIALHDGSLTYTTEYGAVFNNAAVATYDVDISGGVLRLLATPASSSTTNYKIIFDAIKV